MEGFPFNPNMTEQQYSELESLVSATLKVRGLTVIRWQLYSNNLTRT